jgi:Lrp/AsnC family leucine-responsive transcriptional regulator
MYHVLRYGHPCFNIPNYAQLRSFLSAKYEPLTISRRFFYNLSNNIAGCIMAKEATAARDPGGLDEYDLRILERLQSNAGESNVELAEKVGLSPSPCLRRVHRLRAIGVVKKTVSLLDASYLGLSLNIFTVVSLERQDEHSLKEFERAVKDLPEIISCHMITGADADYFLHIVLPDLPTYRKFLTDHITSIPCISRIRSSYSLEEIKTTSKLPLRYARGKIHS